MAESYTYNYAESDLDHAGIDLQKLAECCCGESLMSVFKDAGHLFRFAGLFVLAFLVFLVVRHFVVPKSFGQYGHYRGAAIGEIGARPVKFTGHQTCEACHSDVAEKKNAGKHAHVNCEACHGAIFQRLPAPAAPPENLYQRLLGFAGLRLQPDLPILSHADDPSTVKPVLPDTAVLCARCHEASAAKPKGFPQVAIADHAQGMPCESCHQPHSPGMDAPPAATAGGAK